MLHGRTGRPSVAGAAGDTGAWLLNTRARQWAFLPSDAAVLTVSAVSDEADHTVAVDATGRILIFDGTGATLAATEPVLAESAADPDMSARIQLIVDAHRAYISDPAQNRILEVDYRDARITRIFSDSAALFLAQVG